MKKQTIRLSLFAYLLITSTSVQAIPTSADATVVSGTAAIVNTNSTTTTINQSSDFAEINWTNFDLASGNLVNFNVPRAESVTINRVTSGAASTINGIIQSNGQVYLINENGMTFGKDASFNMPTFIASTIDSFNTQADAQQYAEIIFDSTKYVSSYSVDKFVVIAPFIGFYSTTGYANLSRYFDKKIISANRVNVEFTGADNSLAVTVPDDQPDVTVPANKKLGIEALATAYQVSLTGDNLDMIAKAVSVQQNIDALINLDSDTNQIFMWQLTDDNHLPTIRDYALTIETSGHLMVGDNVNLGNISGITTYYTGYRATSIKLKADKNLFIKDFLRATNNIYIEAGDNLILNAGQKNITGSIFYGIYGDRTIKLKNGDITVDSANYDFDTLGDITSYAPGSIGYVTDYWVSEQNFDQPAIVITGGNTFDYSNMVRQNIALNTTLEAENITINSAINLSDTVSENSFKNAAYFEMSGAIGNAYTYFTKTTPVDGDSAPLTLKASGDVNINANIDMAGMGDLNITAVNVNLANGVNISTGSSTQNTTVLPPPVVEPPVVVTPPPAEPEEQTPPIFEEFTKIKEQIFELLGNKQPQMIKLADTKPVQTPENAVAATCINGICTVLDDEDRFVEIQESFLMKTTKKLQDIAEKTVNLKGLKDAF